MDIADKIFLLFIIFLVSVIILGISMNYTDKQLCNHVGGVYIEDKCLKDKEEVK